MKHAEKALTPVKRVSRRGAILGLAKSLAAGLGTVGVAPHSWGQETAFPTKPVTLIVPFPPGGILDFIARGLAPKLSAIWGQPVIVDNRAGASGNIAAVAALQSPPDGHTVLLGHSGMLINQFLMKNMPYDTRKSFAPISTVTLGPAILYINPSLPAKDFKEFVAYAKSRPGPLYYASGGVGTIPHLTAALLQQVTGLQLIHVPYKGAAPAVNDLMGGQVQMMFDYAVPSGEFALSGRLRALFVAGPKRVPLLPNVPTAAEAGLPGFDSVAWTALFTHAAVPLPIVRKISHDVSQILASAEERTRGEKLGIEFGGSTPEALREILNKDSEQWGEIVRKTDIKLLE